MIRNIMKSFGIVKEDYTQEYWEGVAKKDLPFIMDRITTNFTPKDFAEKKESIIFDLNIPFNKKQTVLDLACGIGRTCKWVAPQVETYIGVDYVLDMVKKAEKYNTEIINALFYQSVDGLRPMLKDDSVDIAYSELAFQHMLRSVQKDYIDELHKIIKPDGKLYVQLPKYEYYNRKQTCWEKDELNDLFRDWAYWKLDNTYPAYYTVIGTPKISFK